MDMDTVVDELYALHPSEFTARRDALAAEARKEGDRDLAGTIKALRKTSSAAYCVNRLARMRPDEMRRLVDLGARMREAQAALSGEELRSLGRQRQQLVAGLAREAARSARDSGHPLSDASEREVESTLEAALADEAAGEAVRSGLLVRALEHSGLDRVVLDGALVARLEESRELRPGGGRAGAALRETRSGPRQGGGERARTDAEGKARAEEEADRTEEEARRAGARQTEAAAALDTARRRREAADASVRRVQDELTRARDEADEAAEAERLARRELSEAEARAEATASNARRARSAADASSGLRGINQIRSESASIVPAIGAETGPVDVHRAK